ncbi:MAG TPA: sugar transferase [Aquihabitans sp.]|jgi:lipopolysaccharide/colanic/teichoic acid biosynthesis glycosyltransferase|nr:sugar transferase [Aquihabitans sp.]
MSHAPLGAAAAAPADAWERGTDRTEGLLVARALVEPMVGQGYLMWLHLASSFAFVGSAPSTGVAIEPTRTALRPAVPTGFDTSLADPCDERLAYRVAKAAIDRGFALVALVALAPLLVVVALLVKRSSPGPVLFRQERIGRDGRLIPVLKFRTMVVDAEERLRRDGLWDRYVDAGYKLPADEDCRITRTGRLLRRTSLDELPQFLNVLRGEMSLVGPRPIVPSELACYGELAACYLGVRPGITGLWQVTGRSSIAFPERAHLDAEYFDRRSLGLDLRILARTPLVVLRCTGAY